MNDKSLKQGINVGTSSLILIFIILCLAVFGLLSLTSAKSDLSLAKRYSESVKGYYDADNKGQEFLQMADQELKEIFARCSPEKTEECRALLEETSPYYDRETDIIRTDIPMDRGQALRVELLVVFDSEVRYEVEAWKVIHTEDYEIDDSMPVWTGV